MIDFQNVIILFLCSLFLFLCFYLYSVIRFLISKRYCEKALGTIKLAQDIVRLKKRISQIESKIQDYPTLFRYVQGIEILCSKYILSLRSVKIFRRKSGASMERFRKEYLEAPKEIRAVVRQYSFLLKKIFRLYHPVRFIISEISSEIRIGFILIRIVIDYIIRGDQRGVKQSPIPLHTQKDRMQSRKQTESIIDSSEMNFAA